MKESLPREGTEIVCEEAGGFCSLNKNCGDTDIQNLFDLSFLMTLGETQIRVPVSAFAL
jgi:hypothetical protein